MKWCRLYSDTRESIDLQLTDEATRYFWYVALEIAADEEANGCLKLAHKTLTPEQVFAMKAKSSPELAKHALKYYVEAAMFSCRRGDYYIKNWGIYQRKSDTSAERTRRWRDGAETSPRRPRAEQRRADKEQPPLPPQRGGVSGFPPCLENTTIKTVGKDEAPAATFIATAFEERFGIPSAVDFSRLCQALGDCATCDGSKPHVIECADRALYGIQRGRDRKTLPGFIRSIREGDMEA